MLCRVHVAGTRPQGPDSALLPGSNREGIEAEMAHRVGVRDRRDVVVGDTVERAHEPFRGHRPGGVRVRVIRLPTDGLEPYFVALGDPRRIVDEAGHYAVTEELA